MFPWRRPSPSRSRRRNAARRGLPQPAEPQATSGRPREISQVSSSFPYSLPSSGPSQYPGSQEQQAERVRRRQPSSGNVQPSRTPTRQRDISQASITFPQSSRTPQLSAGQGFGRQPVYYNVQPPRRPREISQVSVYSMPSGPSEPQGSRPKSIRMPPTTRPRPLNEPSLSSYYAQQPITPPQYPPGRGFGRTPNQSLDLSKPPSRPREMSGGSGNTPYYPRPAQMPRGRRTPPNQYVHPPQRLREHSYTSAPHGYISAPYPSYQQPMRTSHEQGPQPKYVIDPWGRIVPYTTPNQEPTSGKQLGVQFIEEPQVDEPELPFDYPPETFTGFTELPCGKAFLILLLWLPRFFIPWITAWHGFNVFILSNPWQWKDREDDLALQKIHIIVGRSIITILSSVFVDLIRTKCELEYYVYFVLLSLFTLSPVSAGYLDVLLRAQFIDVETYKDQWFSSLVLTQWAISAGFTMFPVQMACIYSQTNVMSRNAHYNWTFLFILLEVINAYIAFLIIPGPCPTKDWTQVAVWAGIGLLLVTVTMLTLIFLFAVRALKHAMMMCCKKEDSLYKEIEMDPFVEASLDVLWKKLTWFSMIALPIIFMSFSVAVLERFVPYDDWDGHNFSSPLGIFLFWKIIGVILMASVMITLRKVYAKKNRPILGTEVLYLGLPHILCILALVTMVGRFATLSHLKEGDVVVGPVPDKDKTVLVFVNTMFRNWTICIRSDFFQPVKIKPNQHVTRELYNIGVDNFPVTMEVDPCFTPAIRTRLQVENIKKGDWKVFDVVLLSMNYTDSATWDYYRTLYAYTLRDEGDLRPKVGAPQLAIFQISSLAPQEDWYYQMNHSTLGSWEVQTNNSVFSNLGFGRNLILWEVPAIGKWTVKLWSNQFNKSDAVYAWATNCTQCVSPLEFEVENNSLYLLVEYYYEEIINFALNLSYFDNPPQDIQFPMYPLSYVLFKLGEVAGPNSDRLPNNEELQKDLAVKISMALAGMAAGGVFLGFVYLFWVDPPVPGNRTIALAVCWVLMGIAADVPRLTHIDISVKVSIGLLNLQIAMTVLHFIGAHFMYTSAYDFRMRPD